MRTGRCFFRSSLAAVLCAGVLATAAPAAGQTASFLVPIDQARILDLDRAAATVVVGNSSIAEATVVDSTRLVITGRSFGTTNLIVLDADGEVILDQFLTVQSSTILLTVYRGAVRETYSCSPTCEPTLNVGDSQSTFSQTSDQIQTRSSLAAGQ